MADRRRVVVGAAVGVPLAFVGLLAAEAVMAARGEYAPSDPGYMVEATVEPSTGAEPTQGPLRVVMLGDSTVAGLGAPTEEESLPVQTAQRVADLLSRPVAVRGLGVSGARTFDVASSQIPLIDDADVVVIVIGSNDVTHATPPWRFDEQTRDMLAAAVERSGGPVVLGGIPLFGSATALAQPLRAVVDAYAKPLRGIQAKTAANTPGVTFVNIAELASPRFRGVPDAMSDDGFHPAPVGYGFWADALAPAIATAAGSS